MSETEVSQRIHDNLAQVRGTMAEACRRSGRDPSEVRLVAVTKYVGLDAIRALLDLGVQDLGENRVQQLTQRADALGAAPLGLHAA